MLVRVKMDIIFVKIFMYWNMSINKLFWGWILIVMYKGIDKVFMNVFVMVRFNKRKWVCFRNFCFINIMMVMRLFVVIIVVININVID